MKKYFLFFLKGAGMGTANVIPGVSGGTIALITGIFEKLINSIKSFDLKAIKLLFTGKFKEFNHYVNFNFLLSVFIGILFSVVTLAKILDNLFRNYPVYIWAYFFGLILASIYFIGKTVEKWNTSVIISFIAGGVIAFGITFLNPATENENFVYLIICGIVAICSMILPGLSGSFVLILMGNYQLVVIEAINNIRLDILLPLLLGAGVGLLAFSHLLSWIFKKFKDQTISLLTGFILGSLGILWPWKNEIYKVDSFGNPFLKDNGEYIVQSYERYLPKQFNSEVFLAITFVIIGIISIWIIEKYAEAKK
ncbi:MAG: DUF368 domain-containing protein [Bacteroidales bacterium]|nr:DUF368 domain-containing protein [Bacteroidales bacterium]